MSRADRRGLDLFVTWVSQYLLCEYSYSSTLFYFINAALGTGVAKKNLNKMKKNYLIFIVFVGLTMTVNAQITFQKKIGGTNADAGNYVQQTKDGGYIIAGYATNFIAGAGKDAYLIKTDVNGNMQWSKTYGGTNNEIATCVQQTLDGGYIITGYSENIYPNYNGFLIKTNSIGDTIWTKSYGYNTMLNFIRQTNDGGYIISGKSNNQFIGINESACLIRIDYLGNILWKKDYYQNNDVTILNLLTVIQTSDGGFISGGNYHSNGPTEEMIVVKTNSAGETLWEKSYGMDKNKSITTIQQTSDGGYIMCGDDYNGSSNCGSIFKTDAQGNIVWNKLYGSNVFFSNVQQTKNGDYIAAFLKPNQPDLNAVYECYSLKLNASGNILWCEKYSGGVNPTGQFMQQTKDGGCIIVGSITTSENTDIYLIKTDSSGKSNCNEEPFLMSSISKTPASETMTMLIASFSSATSSFSCYVNSPSTLATTICSTVGITQLSDNSASVNIYPNPASDRINIEINNQNDSYTLEILNTIGQVVLSKQINNSVEQVDLSGQAAGVYFVKLQSVNNSVVRKIIKQ